MLRITAFLALSLGAFAAEAPKPPRATALESFIQKVLARGSRGRVADPVAELLGVPKDSPTWDAEVFPDQTKDGLYHLFSVTVEESRPKELVLTTGYTWPGNDESYWFRASLDGKLEKAAAIHGRLDEQGKAIKGSGTATEKDTNSPEIKERFQHELDLWLKKAHLKKEWRSAELSQGILQKPNRAGKRREGLN